MKTKLTYKNRLTMYNFWYRREVKKKQRPLCFLKQSREQLQVKGELNTEYELKGRTVKKDDEVWRAYYGERQDGHLYLDTASLQTSHCRAGPIQPFLDFDFDYLPILLSEAKTQVLGGLKDSYAVSVRDGNRLDRYTRVFASEWSFTTLKFKK